jgi:endonuclease/exonuclease/phosphatase family metal-dependent hydrolase
MAPKVNWRKKMFIRELKRLKQSVMSHWLLIGDFNLIYRDQDKNNGRLNRRLMLRFRRALNHLQVKELELMGRRFTWTNNQANPTLTKIGRAFCTTAWEQRFANHILQPLSSSISDHCPLLLTTLCSPPATPRFRFEAHWVNMPGFLECVQAA